MFRAIQPVGTPVYISRANYLPSDAVIIEVGATTTDVQCTTGMAQYAGAYQVSNKKYLSNDSFLFSIMVCSMQSQIISQSLTSSFKTQCKSACEVSFSSIRCGFFFFFFFQKHLKNTKNGKRSNSAEYNDAYLFNFDNCDDFNSYINIAHNDQHY